MPEQTIGQLLVALYNDASQIDLVTNEQLVVEFAANRQLSNVSSISRYGEMLLTVTGDNTAQLMTTLGSTVPSTLALIEIEQQIVATSINSRYLAVMDQSGHVHVYDYQNPYAPALANQLFNNANANYQDFVLADNAIVLSDGADLYIASMLGAQAAKQGLPIVTDWAVDGDKVWLLVNNQLQLRKLGTMSDLAASANLSFNANQLQLALGRVLVSNASTLGVYHYDGTALTSLGSVGMVSDNLALNGELLAVQNNSNLTVYDVDSNAGVLSLTAIADINRGLGHFAAIEQLNFSGHLLEWRAGSSYANSAIPLANIIGLTPDSIASSTDDLKLSVKADAGVWDDVVIDVHADSDGQLVAGFTRTVGDVVSFSLNSGEYVLGERYHVSLFNQPNQNVRGGEVNFDLPLGITTDSLFGIEPMTVNRLVPANTITGRATQFVVHGQGLQHAESLNIGGISLTNADWQVNSAGTELSFTAILPTAGVFNLALNQAGQTASLPAAALVAESLSVANVLTDNAKGNDKLSDSGGDKVTVIGAGFAGNLNVHLFAANEGLVAHEHNLVTHTITETGLSFTSPAVIAGKQYQLVIQT